MIKKIFLILFLVLFIITNTPLACTSEVFFSNEMDNVYNTKMKQDLLCFFLAYPGYITSIEKDNGYVNLVMKSGKKVRYDDKTKKNEQEKLYNPDLQDTLVQLYPLSKVTSIMHENFDPGRLRCYGFLSEVYGKSKKDIESNLTLISSGYTRYQFNSNNNAAFSLKAAMNDLITLSKRNENVRKCLFPISGTFNYRVISGTNRLSPHSFGIAIDLASDKRDYWKWASKESGEKRLSSYPNELVEIFENSGFIWGGKWSHFDILHFEYRPELILKARYFNSTTTSTKNWYEGAPVDNPLVKTTIEQIDTIFK